MELEEAIKLLKEIKEELLEDMNTAEEWASLGEGYEGVTKEEEEKVKAIEVVLKEIEYLKKNQRYKKDFNGEKIFCLEYDKETLRDMVLEKQEEIKELKSNSIPKDKIREIIEELNKDIEEEFKKCSGRGPTIALHSLTFCRDEFKELLEEG